MTVRGKQLTKCIRVLLLVGLCCLLSVGSVQAAVTHQWQLTGESADGLAQQYVDLNSIRSQGNPARHQWIVDSYFTQHKLNQDVRSDYVTLYDCDRHRYKDINADGLPAGDWGDALTDPLNLATMDFVCQHVAE